MSAIQTALGAQKREVLEMALSRSVKLLAIGSAAALALGILASGLWHPSSIRRP